MYLLLFQSFTFYWLKWMLFFLIFYLEISFFIDLLQQNTVDTTCFYHVYVVLFLKIKCSFWTVKALFQTCPNNVGLKSPLWWKLFWTCSSGVFWNLKKLKISASFSVQMVVNQQQAVGKTSYLWQKIPRALLHSHAPTFRRDCVNRGLSGEVTPPPKKTTTTKGQFIQEWLIFLSLMFTE